jgi:hypothetical protein
VGIAKTGSSPSFQYSKRDADGKLVFESKTYTPEASATNPSLYMLGLDTDKSGAVSVFGALRGPFSFDDGVHGPPGTSTSSRCASSPEEGPQGPPSAPHSA